MIRLLLFLLAFTSYVNAFEWREPTARFIEKESWEKIDAGLHEVDLSPEHKDFFDSVAKGEEIGFFGYHASTQEFRIYQDIIRLVLEEALHLHIRSDFHFFRIPGEPRYNHHSIKDYGNYVNDYSPTDFICLNYSIYSNYSSDFYSSYYYFATNTSSSSIDFEEKIQWLFDQLGIDKRHMDELFTIGRKYLGESSTGVIFQLFDKSHPYYASIDPLLGTFAHNDMPFSQAIEGKEPSHFYLQLRLLMSNQCTLNPESPIVVKRFDLTPPEVIKQYEEALRTYMRSIKVDQKKAQMFSATLKNVWKTTMSKAPLQRPEGYPPRVPVPKAKTDWNVAFDDYLPARFTHEKVQSTPSWADPEDFSLVTRTLKSYEGNILFDPHTHLPLNPHGRTGIQGRGLLGKWGPNFACDPIITRINPHTNQIEMLAIQRRDNGQWAIPGGMVDEGEDISSTLTRELYEETGVQLDMKGATELYRGYVDDPRNTDNAWIETIAKHKHLSPEEALQLHPKAGSDAKAVRWLPLTEDNIQNLYANHEDLVRLAIKHNVL